jgi:hypothetical protein
MTLFIGALIVGLTLGLLGSGGSILTVPVLVYMLGHSDKVAIAESLAIVGAIALAGMLPYARRHQVDWRSVALFGIPGMGGTYIGAYLAKFVSGPVQLTLFAVIMLAAAVMMFRQGKQQGKLGSSADEATPVRRHGTWKIVLEGLAVGIITGLVGVGGGFLIVPALVILGGLPMRLAIGTSLMVVALKSFSGFFKYLGVLSSLGASVHWPTIGIFITVGVIGTLIGNALNRRVNQQALKRGFAAFLVVMGIFVLIREVPHVMADARVPKAGSAASTVVDGEALTPKPRQIAEE